MQANRIGGLAIIAILASLTGCRQPVQDTVTLQAIEREAKALAARTPASQQFVPKSRWPHHIAQLDPMSVTISPDGVDILTKPYFDGGWGYFITLDSRKGPPSGPHFSKIGHDIYWYQPD